MISNTAVIWNAATNSYDSNSKQLYEYNANNLPTRNTLLYWNGSIWAIDLGAQDYHFYYENYTTLGLETTGIAPELICSPNPASSELSIKICSARDYVASLSDMQGRVFRKITRTGGRNGVTNISVKDLPAGIYALSVQTTGGSSAVKLITVAH